MICFGNVPAGSVLPIIFDSFAASTGASVTLTGLAVTDIEVYKGTSVTQRASDAGYALIDTDGIDIDGVTGIHGFSIDTGDNTDTGFYAAGSFYTVVVSAVTIDSQTVNFVAATFRIDTNVAQTGDSYARLGAPVGASISADIATVDGNVDSILADTGTDGVVVASGSKTGYSLTATTGLGNQTANITGNLSGSVGSVTGAVGSVTGAVGSVTGNVGGNVAGSVASVTGDVGGNVDGTVAGVTPATAAQVAAVLTTQITESYRANAAAPTLAQFMSEVLAHLGEVSISGTTKTINKLDHTTAAATFTLDDATTPAAITRAT